VVVACSYKKYEVSCLAVKVVEDLLEKT